MADRAPHVAVRRSVWEAASSLNRDGAVTCGRVPGHRASRRRYGPHSSIVSVVASASDEGGQGERREIGSDRRQKRPGCLQTRCQGENGDEAWKRDEQGKPPGASAIQETLCGKQRYSAQEGEAPGLRLNTQMPKRPDKLLHSSPVQKKRRHEGASGLI